MAVYDLVYKDTVRVETGICIINILVSRTFGLCTVFTVLIHCVQCWVQWRPPSWRDPSCLMSTSWWTSPVEWCPLHLDRSGSLMLLSQCRTSGRSDDICKCLNLHSHSVQLYMHCKKVRVISTLPWLAQLHLS